ncbi:hypothetical protein GCM10027271_03390 [Saccharopolyspora gloriosae]|uniref:Type VII secretion system-associated protein n=1 Tax=Saccharopolyspora gloriosae TaxID=455344 RepID=A0A840NRJ7_9PSEU|nr:type VII secretion system-associated protein [Saccharopolyspora gloriosae]MBB5071889.1 hypothetical protein [Saccharopolyspora gloriosae]
MADTSPTDTAPTDTGRDQWALLVDPGWQPEDEDAEVPESAIVGAWLVEADGTTRTFRANHLFQPSSPDVPTDPVDAELKLVLRGESDTASLLGTLRPAELWIAVDEQGAAIVTPAPDDVPSVLVATAPVQAQQLEVPGWQEIGATELAAELPADGVDVLLNPGGAASVRIGAQEFRDAVADEDAAGQPVVTTSATPEAAPAPAARADGPNPGDPAAEHAPATAQRATAAAPPAATGEPAPATAEHFAADLAAWRPMTAPDAEQPPYPAEELDGFDDPLPPPPSFPGKH